MCSNPVEAPENLFFRLFRLNCDSLRWSHIHFTDSHMKGFALGFVLKQRQTELGNGLLPGLDWIFDIHLKSTLLLKKTTEEEEVEWSGGAVV